MKTERYLNKIFMRKRETEKKRDRHTDTERRERDRQTDKYSQTYR